MRNIQLMAVTNRFHESLHDSTCFIFIVELLLNNLLKEFSAIHKLSHDEVIVLVFIEALQADDVFMIQLHMRTSLNSHSTHDEDLILQTANIVLKEVVLLNALHRIALIRVLIHTRVHHRISAGAERFLHFLYIIFAHHQYKAIEETMLDSSAGLLLRRHDGDRRSTG